MNFLAHAYLSGDSRDLIIGNFIADAIKGKDYDMYRQGIIDGILLHRNIDSFTDRHPVVGESKARLRPYFSKYSSVVADIYYDHFLAHYWSEYSHVPLRTFTKNVYAIIRSEYATLPPLVHRFFPYMEKDDWLSGYATFEGMSRVFNGMSRRAKFNSNMENAVDVLKANYSGFEGEFRLFFPELKAYVDSLRS